MKRRKRLGTIIEQRTEELVEANRRLVGEAAEQQRLGQVVRDLAERISRWHGGRLELGAVLDDAAATIGLALQVDIVTVRLAEDERLGPLVVRWKAPGIVHAFGAASDAQTMSVLEDYGKRATSLRIPDLAEFPPVKQDQKFGARFLAVGVKAIVLTPIVAGDGTYLGTVSLVHTSRTRDWSDDDIALAESLARAVARAVQQVKLYEGHLSLLQSLQELDGAKSEFLLTVSHELRTPLTSIAGYVELLRSGDAGELTQEQDDLLSIVDRNVDRLASLVGDVVTLCNLDLDTTARADEPVPLAEVVARVAERVNKRPTDQPLSIQVAAEPGSMVLGDAEALERLFLAVFDNAAKFSPSGGSIEAEVRVNGACVLTTVRDPGIGIPTDEQAEIFDRLYRASNARTLQIPGSGLGLAIAKTIAEQHGGSISVSSRIGAGTTISVTLPTANGSHA